MTSTHPLRQTLLDLANKPENIYELQSFIIIGHHFESDHVNFIKIEAYNEYEAAVLYCDDWNNEKFGGPYRNKDMYEVFEKFINDDRCEYHENDEDAIEDCILGIFCALTKTLSNTNYVLK